MRAFRDLFFRETEMKMKIPIKISGIEFKITGCKLRSQWLDTMVDPASVSAQNLFDAAMLIINLDGAFTNVKMDSLFIVSSHKQTSLHIDATRDMSKSILEICPDISEDSHIVVWVRQ